MSACSGIGRPPERGGDPVKAAQAGAIKHPGKTCTTFNDLFAELEVSR
jgi:hypothetical protein